MCVEPCPSSVMVGASPSVGEPELLARYSDAAVDRWPTDDDDGVVGGCDRTTSEMRGLSPKIILGDSRRSENAQTHTNRHTIPNMKFKLELLQIKCHVLGFTKDKAQNVLQELIRVLRKRSSLTIGTRSSP
jgi:hypothetical protein